MPLITGNGWILHTTITRLNRETTPGSQGGPRVQGPPSLEKCTRRHTYSRWEDPSCALGRRWIVGHLSRLLTKERSLNRVCSQHSETHRQCSRGKPRSVGMAGAVSREFLRGPRNLLHRRWTERVEWARPVQPQNNALCRECNALGN